MRRSRNKNRRSTQLGLITGIGAAVAGSAGSAFAGNWTGTTSGAFGVNTNWTGNVLPTSNELLTFNNIATANTTITGDITFTGTSGKIATGGSTSQYTFGASVGANTITLFNATVDGILNGVAGTTLTINDNVVIGDGAASTTSITSNVAGALVDIKGNVTGGSGAATPGTLVFSLGSTSSKNGDYTISGNITKGGASTITLNKRGTGTATLSGTNTVNLMFSNEANGVIRITGGTTTIANNTAGSTWGGGNSAGVIRVSGGTLAAGDARIGNTAANSILVDGGTLTVNSQLTAGNFRLSMGGNTNSGAQSLTLSSGSITVFGGLGVRLGGDNGAGATNGGATGAFTATQSGGTFTITGGTSTGTGFSLGSSSAGAGIINTYNMSAGTLSVNSQGAGGSGRFDLGASTDGTSSAIFNLSGGKLIVRSGVSGTTSGIQGAQAGGVQVLSLTGGTLVTGNIVATNLRGSQPGANGTLVNNGTTISPGDAGSSGKTSITGGFTANSGTLAIDLGGTTASTAFQDVGLGKFDQLAVSGNAALGGSLSVSLISGYTPLQTDSFTVLTSGGLSGAFSNVAFGSRLAVGGGASFLVSQSGNNVVLSDFSTATSTISLTASAANTNLADSSNPYGAVGSVVDVVGSGSKFVSEVDDLTANQNKGSATIAVNPGPITSPVYAMLWLTGQTSGTLEALRAALDGIANVDAYTGAAPGDQWSTLSAQGQYNGFNLLVKFTGAAAANPGALNWDFAAQSSILVDKVAIVPEPTAFGLIGVSAAGMVIGRRRRR